MSHALFNKRPIPTGSLGDRTFCWVKKYATEQHHTIVQGQPNPGKRYDSARAISTLFTHIPTAPIFSWVGLAMRHMLVGFMLFPTQQKIGIPGSNISILQ